MLLVELATLSRSGILGLVVGVLVLVVPYRRRLVSAAFLAPLAGVTVVLAAIVLSRLHFFEVVVRSRVQTGGRSESAHLAVFDFIPQILHSHPLFGLGLNTFSVYYEFVTGKSNWGPHSFYVALVVETGLVGTVAGERVRARGVEVAVVSPASFPHFGIAYGHGIVGNLRRRPWLAALLPPMLAAFARAARHAARDADLVHGHWLPAGWVAARTGRPYVVQLWGTDVSLARRVPRLAARVLG